MTFNLEDFQLTNQDSLQEPNLPKPKLSKHAKKKIIGPFLKGPIPLDWLLIASRFRGVSTLKVAIVLWHLAGLNKRHSGLVLTIKRCKPWGVDRKGVKNALNKLEASGLIRVERVEGRARKVDILIDQYFEPKL